MDPHLDASVEATQKPADEEVGWWVGSELIWGLLDGGRGKIWADTSLGRLGADERNLDRGCFQARLPHVHVNTRYVHTGGIVSACVSS